MAGEFEKSLYKIDEMDQIANIKCKPKTFIDFRAILSKS